jgi:hypothetical protein
MSVTVGEMRYSVVDIFTGEAQNEAPMSQSSAYVLMDELNKADEATRATAGSKFVLRQIEHRN